MRIASLLLVVVGIAIMAFPSLTDLYSGYQEEKLLKTYYASAQESEEVAFESYKELNDIFNRVESAEKADEVTVEDNNNNEKKKKTPSKVINKNKEPIGILKIKKINLQLPIVEGTTEKHLRSAAGHIPGTGTIGETGNAAIAAHRSFKPGKLFNRLDELVIGDIILINSTNGDFSYKVDKIYRVTPDDLSVLTPNKDTSIITLITCDPMINPTHRLIVQASLTSTK